MPSALEEKDAIREVLATYCFHLDAGKFEDMAALFTEDGTWHTDFGKGTGRAGIRSMRAACGRRRTEAAWRAPDHQHRHRARRRPAHVRSNWIVAQNADTGRKSAPPAAIPTTWSNRTATGCSDIARSTVSSRRANSEGAVPKGKKPNVVNVGRRYPHRGHRYRPGLLARLYRPAGDGPFPAIVEVHGGAWVNSDRLNNAPLAETLAGEEIMTLSLDFRMPPEAGYPASLQDINYGVRWLKSRARDVGAHAERIGLFGTSSGGHQVLLAAMRPFDPRYAALALPGAPDVDARVAFVISAWGVLCPLERYGIAKAANNATILAPPPLLGHRGGDGGR